MSDPDCEDDGSIKIFLSGEWWSATGFDCQFFAEDSMNLYGNLRDDLVGAWFLKLMLAGF